ncbi:MAG: AMP-binding protein [Bacteroidetes bacterium]|nr:AMP-binding protein [Bacteroidota bacterium]
MNTTWQNIHPAFKLNGLKYSSTELCEFAKDLEDKGTNYEISIGNFLIQWLNEDPTVMVKTSGSTGKPKDILLNKDNMVNSANATGIFFKLAENTTALLCLPSNFIAGKMMLVRAMILGWDLHITAPEKDALTQYDNDYDFVAMVPFQVLHSIDALKKVKKLIIGGGSISKELEAKLINVDTEVFATYGMTETITHIAVKRLNGLAKSAYYTALPNVKFSKDDRGCLIISAPDISEKEVITNDIITLVSPTSFEWLGRYDNVINSGGIKIFPEKVEEKLSAFIQHPFIITSEKDEQLGERVILIIETKDKNDKLDLSEAISKLERYERPKKIYTFSEFPFTETGKIKRDKILQILLNRKI